MRRAQLAPRADWEDRLKSISFDDYVREDGSFYWIEDACIELTSAEVNTLQQAARACEQLSRKAIAQAMGDGGRLRLLGLNERLSHLALESWRRRDPSLYGRFDLAWNGEGPPKLLEYNADGATSLYESTVVQRQWLTDRGDLAGQLNSGEERLIAGWRARAAAIPAGGRLHVVSRHSEFDAYGTAWYVGECAKRAGLIVCELDVSDIGISGGRLVDLEGRPITHMFKLYPWDWLAREDEAFFEALCRAEVGVIEPPWRVVAASKGLLVDMWGLAPDCPYLLSASFDECDIPGERVGKPLLGRQGENIRVRFAGRQFDAEGAYADQPIVWQARARPAFLGGRTQIFGVWVIAGNVCGIGVREEAALVTGPDCSFIPHRIVQEA